MNELRPTLDVIEKLEAETFEFTKRERNLIRYTCGGHARSTDMPADKNHASAIASRIAAALEEYAIN